MPSPDRRFRAAIYEQFSRIPKAFANPHRLEILQILAQAPRSVEVLSRLLETTLANTSQHLQVLRAAGLVEARKQGLFVTYRIADPSVIALLGAVRLMAEDRLGDVGKITREFLAENGQLEPVDQAELLRKIEAGAVTLVDVRPAEEYAAGHVAGAISIPLPDLARRLDLLPRPREVVALCRGKYCALGIEAVRLLRDAGFRAVRLERGIHELAGLGLPIEQDEPAPAA